MMDGRRHSVDIPISRTLIALRRVRSLRDPSTNCMSKFSALLENVNWETNSTNGISLQFTGGCQQGGSDHNGFARLNNSGLNRIRDEEIDDFHLQHDLVKSKPNLNLAREENAGASLRTKKLEGLDNGVLYQEDVSGKKSLSERYYINHRDKGLELTCITPLSNAESNNELILRSPKVECFDQSISRKKSQYKNHDKSSGMVGDILSRVGSPCLSVSDALSSYGVSLLANEDTDFMVQNDRGCGISCCWTRTPRFRESNPYSDVEGRPLLLKDLAETIPHGQRNLKLITNESPRSFSQKFRPKSFEELVGQNVVVRSLLSAIAQGRVTSLYLFHGPRGTGKTSASRIFAAALNCLSLEEYKPCGLCRECVQFFSGRSRDVKEVDSVRINRVERIRALIKNAAIPPVSSRFKVFIVDECHLLQGETWATILNSLENLPQHVVFVMVTPHLDKLPRSAVTHSQKYHFPKIKDADIAVRLKNICIEEGIDFDQVALDFIAAKSNGSLRDAEMMLDQMSLLGKRITMSLAYELVGVVSDDELLDLLDLALSSDTSNTVIRARELMRSRIDPMQLVSQLANIIMDMLAGKCQEDSSEVRRKFSSRHATEADMQRLSHALKVLSETEKQLRMSKSQSTWLTVALLQLSSLEAPFLNANDPNPSIRNAQDRDGDFCSTSSTGESLKLLLPCSCEDGKLHNGGDCKATLESIWKNATELCQSNSLRNFLGKQGKLSSLCVNQDLAVAELEFHRPDYVSKAEKSWKTIASALQSILGRNVEIRINLVLCDSALKCKKLRKLPFSLFSCSRRVLRRSQLPTECGSDSDYSGHMSEKPIKGDRVILTCSSDCRSQMPHYIFPRVDVVKALRNNEGNVLSIGRNSSHRSLQDDTLKIPAYGNDSLKEEGGSLGYETFSSEETEEQPNCFSRTLRLQKRLPSTNHSRIVCMGNQEANKLALSFPAKRSIETCNSTTNGSYVLNSNNDTNNSRSEDGLTENSAALCWRTPTFTQSKAWQLTHHRRRSPLARWVLPCASAK
ncbi:protein STICHEL-like 2 [Ricinus communis]|uniref:protein STICHEL-like 2 n=1 Tax=Ricinus communis TaxID=3988 RepID=UPI00201A5B75|nr:protein STICHEL-like 2 [Ricinus communis]XP_015579019.2 protein STICHEL-like 2 [Ricinus communis]XP_015579025.2 protein STICHEL-like 2 [Ricinus communis]XP_048228798.1 protein STICHEL-like 2 [Ricinus communis]